MVEGAKNYAFSESSAMFGSVENPEEYSSYRPRHVPAQPMPAGKTPIELFNEALASPAPAVQQFKSLYEAWVRSVATTQELYRRMEKELRTNRQLSPLLESWLTVGDAVSKGH